MAQSILIIGGGAAGMVAGVSAARRGASVRILERMSRVGKKLLATGNGRCNLTNQRIVPDCYHGSCAGAFAAGIFQQFDVERTLTFFRELGVEPVVEEEGRIYPASGQASSVLDILRHELESLGVETICDANAQRLEKRRGSFLCATTDGRLFEAESVIVAAGGKSSPNLGSNGGGFKLAELLGHPVAEPFPALVQVTLDEPFLKQLAGLKLHGRAEACVDGEPVRADVGELLFTEYGLSGVAIFQISRVFSDPVHRGRALCVRLDLFPGQTQEDLSRTLQQRFHVHCARKPLDFGLVGLIHKRLIPVILRAAGLLDLKALCGSLTVESIGRLAGLLKGWPLRVTGTQSWMHSQVTAGGVMAEAVNARTLESLQVPGLFFCGEVLDIDGDCGGFNLQWAWSSGFVAGFHAAGGG